MKRWLVFCAPMVVFLACSSCFDTSKVAAPTVYGVYSMHVSDSSIHHGVDILILNSDQTYVHVYTHGWSRKDLMESGRWEELGNSRIGFDNFVPWDLYGPLPDGVMYPDPALATLPLKQDLDGNYEIDANSDRGESWVQVERFAH